MSIRLLLIGTEDLDTLMSKHVWSLNRAVAALLETEIAEATERRLSLEPA